jgi:hypothetical protein
MEPAGSIASAADATAAGQQDGCDGPLRPAYSTKLVARRTLTLTVSWRAGLEAGPEPRLRPLRLPLSYLSADEKGREAARRAENAYSGISHSGNQRVTSSSNGSSAPTCAFRRSSRSESRAFSPGAGTNG